MINSFKRVIKLQRQEVDKDIILGKPKEYSSYLILSFTDFGDNASDVYNFSRTIQSFEEFAESYHKESQSLNNKGEKAFNSAKKEDKEQEG